jgi:hypothetical protein
MQKRNDKKGTITRLDVIYLTDAGVLSFLPVQRIFYYCMNSRGESATRLLDFGFCPPASARRG